ncbi:MAG TPA: hypothetical protein VLF43_03285, partial [Candidatus Saccharimonadales bacterium]|nr:hypothetical protein [Candidatus Saccharimonadales bacterium]
MSEHVIELNGKRYDANTGALVGVSAAVAKAAAPVHRKKVIDGFVRQTAPKKTVHTAATTAAVQAKPITAKPTTKLHPDIAALAVQKQAKVARTHTARTAKRKPEHSKTLMRTTVKRPDISRKPAIKPQAPAEIMAKPVSAIAQKH